jgi:hypothetical protein
MNAKILFALALSTPLFVSSAEAIVYTVRTDSGLVTYSLEVPPGTPVGDKIKPHPQVGYSANFPMTAGSAEVVAVRWAGGLKDKDKTDNYPNSLTILGGKIPGGFYNATFTKPTSVQRINGRFLIIWSKCAGMSPAARKLFMPRCSTTGISFAQYQ